MALFAFQKASIILAYDTFTNLISKFPSARSKAYLQLPVECLAMLTQFYSGKENNVCNSKVLTLNVIFFRRNKMIFSPLVVGSHISSLITQTLFLRTREFELYTPFYELQTPYFAYIFIWTVETN